MKSRGSKTSMLFGLYLQCSTKGIPRIIAELCTHRTTGGFGPRRASRSLLMGVFSRITISPIVQSSDCSDDHCSYTDAAAMYQDTELIWL